MSRGTLGIYLFGGVVSHELHKRQKKEIDDRYIYFKVFVMYLNLFLFFTLCTIWFYILYIQQYVHLVYFFWLWQNISACDFYLSTKTFGQLHYFHGPISANNSDMSMFLHTPLSIYVIIAVILKTIIAFMTTPVWISTSRTWPYVYHKILPSIWTLFNFLKFWRSNNSSCYVSLEIKVQSLWILKILNTSSSAY